MLANYLEKLGLDTKERTIYLVLAELGVQPASVIARRCKLDRVTTYKHLKQLADRGFVKVYFRDSVQCFGIESFENLQANIKEKLTEFEELLSLYPTAANLLHSLKAEEDVIPRLELYEGESGIKNFFRDIVFTAKEENIRQIRLLTANTFEEGAADEALQEVVEEFLADLDERKITIQLFEVTGSLVPERLRSVPHSAINAKSIPMTRGTTTIFLVGRTVYIACLKGAKMGLRIKQAELSQIFHFLFDVVGRRES
ncbi:MAG: helix-turn-helix domain-containing protein [Candidatus Peregrinibacteria bacterium]|nr:helix-turn-helix domain-containing protein [Candidatus Peregrinibacteria bacterium]